MSYVRTGNVALGARTKQMVRPSVGAVVEDDAASYMQKMAPVPGSFRPVSGFMDVFKKMVPKAAKAQKAAEAGGGPGVPPPEAPSTGMSLTTKLLIGGVVAGGAALLLLRRKK